MQRGRGAAARVLPEWIWERVETHRPSLTQREAMALINSLLDPAEQPIKGTWYRRHAALRQWQRLTLAAAQPAAQHHTPAEPAAASSTASIDSALGADDPTPHACDHADASGGTHSPSRTPTDTPAHSVSGSPYASPASPERLDIAAAEPADFAPYPSCDLPSATEMVAKLHNPKFQPEVVVAAPLAHPSRGPLGSKRAADDSALTSEQVSQMRRELKLSRMRESMLRLEVQQVVARNRELELQLKVYKEVTQPTLRGAEAGGSHRQARWCAPSFQKPALRGWRRPCCLAT
jgi:hypothetical protein